MPNPTDYFPASAPNRILEENLKYEDAFEAERRDGFKDKLRDTLFSIGVPPRLHPAGPDILPPEISSLRCFDAMPEMGFGLVGEGGVGKSCALTYGIKKTLVREWAEAGPVRLVNEPPRDIRGAFEGPFRHVPTARTEFRWIGWPAFASRMKNFAARREWTNPQASTEELILWLTTFPKRRALILDDIGMEGVKSGSYTSEQLELLVDEAWNYECKVFWTSNRTVEEMAEPGFYGYRLVSRLTGLSPDAPLPSGMPDLRIRRME
jgi:hypothetical protein